MPIFFKKGFRCQPSIVWGLDLESLAAFDWGLFHRSQHVVSSDRANTKGQFYGSLHTDVAKDLLFAYSCAHSYGRSAHAN